MEKDQNRASKGTSYQGQLFPWKAAIIVVFGVLISYICLQLSFDVDINRFPPIESINDLRESNSQPRKFDNAFLEIYRSVYGKYGLTRPDEIPEALNINRLKIRLSRDLPIVKYYNMLSDYIDTDVMRLRKVWESCFRETTDEDMTDKLYDSLSASIKIEGETDMRGQTSAFVEAYHTLEREGQVSNLAIRKVHAALYTEQPSSDKNNISGEFRHVQALHGRNLTASVFEIEAALREMSHYYNSNCKPLRDLSIESALCALHFYRSYEQIHPFKDGSGRTGRAWLNAMLMHKKLPPLAFPKRFISRPRLYYALFDQAMVSRDEFLMKHLQMILDNASL